MADHALHRQPAESETPAEKWLKRIAIGTALAAGAVILSPYILPALGIGKDVFVDQAINQMHPGEKGVGLAGAINEIIKTIPGIGIELAKGGWATAAATGITGIGGALLANYMETKEDGSKGVRWSSVIRTAALLTSSFIALPTALTGISIGIVYLCAAFSSTILAGKAIALLADTLGAVGSMKIGSTGLTGAAAALPHLLTCGLSGLPVIGSLFLGKGKPAAQSHAMHETGGENTQTFAGRIAHEAQATAETASTYEAQVSHAPLVAGQRADVTITYKNRETGAPLTPDMLATRYTQKLHLMLTDQSLSDFHHVHPEPTGKPGEYRFSFTPKTANGYHSWSDFTLNNGTAHKMHAHLSVPGENKTYLPGLRQSSTAEASDLVFTWSNPEPTRQGEGNVVEITVTDKQGNPVTNLEPVMGAFSHMAGFSRDGHSFIHCHPLGREPSTDADRGGPQLRFLFQPEHAGATQFHLHVRHKGQDVFVPFAREILQQRVMAATGPRAATLGPHIAHGR